MNHEEILKNRDWSGADLMSQALGGLDLRGKVFRGADLSFAHLGCTDLRGADLRNANLKGANLGSADLRGADMRYAILNDTNLDGALLLGADLRHTHLNPSTNQSSGAAHYMRPMEYEETEAYAEALDEGFMPISHWGKAFELQDSKRTLRHNETVWRSIKSQLGPLIFGNRSTYHEVRLVQRYKHYSQWAYMITKKGFEQIAETLGLRINSKT